MSYRLSQGSLTHAVRHLTRFGDTDVFPHLPELAFLRDCDVDILKELEALDLDSYGPGSAAEALAPKSRFGFRIVHQRPLLDSILLLATVVEIGELIEKRRPPAENLEAFSYRFSLDGTGGLFRSDRTYKDWLHAQLGYVQSNLKIKRIISTDVPDFYSRINFHRLKNLLDEAAPSHGASRYIKKHIKVIRVRQSFGLPVGGSAARLLAELALSDTDKALQHEGHLATRFVDDFRIFLRSNEDPYDVLAMLAEQLGINEGLSLNVAKTKLSSRSDFIKKLKNVVTDIAEEPEVVALESLTADLYFDDQPDQAELEKLKEMNLLGFLQEEVGKELFDMGRIKVIFRALKLARPTQAIDYLITNFSELVVFAKDVTLLLQALEADNAGCFNALGVEITKAILSPPASSIQLIRTCLLELFVRGTVPVEAAMLKRLEGLSSVSDRRQLHLIRGRCADTNFFRKNKAAFDHLSSLEQPCFVWGAACFAKDEYEVWLKAIKPKFSMPLGHLFLKWAEPAA
jgi:hypothetical protein